MSEEQEQPENKKADIKDKLKDMGVMRDDNATPTDKATPFWRSKLMLVILLGVGLWTLVWFTQKPGDEQQAKQGPNQTTAGTQVPPYGYPAGPGMMQAPAPGQYSQPHTTGSMHDGAMEHEARDPWGGPMTRAHDPYGPPPGWGGPMPYGPYGYYPPPPPAYYGYGPYYGPPPGYGYPYGWNPYPPMPPAQAQSAE